MLKTKQIRSFSQLLIIRREEQTTTTNKLGYYINQSYRKSTLNTHWKD